GGMVRAKSVLTMMMMRFGALGLISVLWVLYGYSLAFGNDAGGGLVGNPDFVRANAMLPPPPASTALARASRRPPPAAPGPPARRRASHRWRSSASRPSSRSSPSP